MTSALLLLTALQAATLPTAPASSPVPVAPSSEVTLQLAPGSRVKLALADRVPCETIARKLETLLKVPVFVAPQLRKKPITLRMKERPLAELLLALAPRAETDLRIESKGDTLAAVRLGPALPPGLASAPAMVPLAGILLEGNTEDESDPPKPAAPGDPPPSAAPEGPSLYVAAGEGRVTVIARQQGIGLVLFEVARAIGVPFLMRASEAPVLPQLDATDVRVSDLPGILGEGVVVEVRRDVATGDDRPLRILYEVKP